MHASLDNGALTIFASDGQQNEDVVEGTNVNLSISGSDEALLTKYFAGLSDGGTVTHPLQKEVWGDIFGHFTDKFGFHWMINITQPKS